ncbi:MAG: C_GCAxxG_C_C family protein [Eubacterium sp.]|nr:C_GCAxxG_C_C family protein [Eubacterium sp.]
MGERANKAYDLFTSGCNCSQAVFIAFCDKYGIDNDTAMKLAASFGGGMGRSREVCGAVSGMLLVCGMETGTADTSDQAQKAENYRISRVLMERFKEENGSIYCRELLGLTKAEASPVPEARTEKYYKKRPCAEIVKCAAQILEDELFEL